MKTYFKSILLYTMLLLSALSVKAKSTSERMSNMEVLSWNNCLTLPSFNSMPNKGIAGAFFGFSNDWLVLAGGTNFPDSVPWKGGTKQWHKTAYIKQAGSADQEWIVLPNTLPHPLAYGASIQIKQGILCIGGCGDRQYNKCYHSNTNDTLPMCTFAALHNNWIYFMLFDRIFLKLSICETK